MLTEFSVELVKFTASRKCSDNWNRTVIEWIALELRSDKLTHTPADARGTETES